MRLHHLAMTPQFHVIPVPLAAGAPQPPSLDAELVGFDDTCIDIAM